MPFREVEASPPHQHPDLVKDLAKELATPSNVAGFDVPAIKQEKQRYGDSLHVTVIWNRWNEVPDKAERGAVILEAYRESGRVNDARRITIALGLTSDEADRLKIVF